MRRNDKYVGRTIPCTAKLVQAPDEPMSNSRGREHHLKAWRFTLLHGCWSLQCGYCHGCQLRMWVLWWGSATRVNSRYFRCVFLSSYSEWISKISRIPFTLWPSYAVLRFFVGCNLLRCTNEMSPGTKKVQSVRGTWWLSRRGWMHFRFVDYLQRG